MLYAAHTVTSKPSPLNCVTFIFAFVPVLAVTCGSY